MPRFELVGERVCLGQRALKVRGVVVDDVETHIAVDEAHPSGPLHLPVLAGRHGKQIILVGAEHGGHDRAHVRAGL
ncbi:hypothetical protein ABNIH11_19236 [Acinetobacter baumannii ABNIH11]|nr:hypothetical protein ABNIH11_19236 [Acinetobacter baumannii ABNIH11]EMU06966.1 hypothetical protein ABNIH10_11635 [Acinetobacter baumannii ABNIH10]